MQHIRQKALAALTTALCISGTQAVGVSGARATTSHPAGAFNWLVPRHAPGKWHTVQTPSGRASLSYPPGFEPVKADDGAVSFAIGPSPRYDAYINVTPQEGLEQIRGFASFRVGLLGDDDVAVREEASAGDVRFFGGRGSCVQDDYRTRAGSNHYREIACLVVGRHFGTVIVTAARTSDWGHFQNVFHRVVAAFAAN